MPSSAEQNDIIHIGCKNKTDDKHRPLKFYQSFTDLLALPRAGDEERFPLILPFTALIP